MDLHYVDYGLSKWKGKLCSTCLLFTNENIAYIPVGRIIKTGGIESVIDYYKKLGESYYQELLDMLVFDAVILNEDRHFGNFGFLIDNKLTKEEISLFNVMISMPSTININNNEYKKVVEVKSILDYTYRTSNFINLGVFKELVNESNN